MKCCILVLVFFCLAHRGTARNALEEDLLTFFDMMLKGDSNFPLPVPPLDEITLPKLEGMYKEQGVQVSYSTSEIKLTGLPKARIHDLIADVSNTTLIARGVLAAPSLLLTADKYKLNGRAFLFIPISGEGKLWANFQNCVVLFDIELGTNGKSTWVEKLQFGAQVDKITVEMTGTSNLIKNKLNSKAASAFAQYREDMAVYMAKASIPWINSYLKDMPTSQILDTIASVNAPRLR